MNFSIDQFRLDGKVAVVTGAGGRGNSIGRAYALGLSKAGAQVVVADIQAEGAQQVCDEIVSAGGNAIAVSVDITKPDSVRSMATAARAAFGGVDILVNNAAVTVGYSWAAPLLEMPRADWLHHFAVNLHAPFTLAQLVVPSMEARGGGRILNVTTGSAEAHRLVEEPHPASSVRYYHGDESGGIPAPGASMNIPALWSPAYFASKRALDRMSNVLAPQLAARNVFIMGVMPGWVATESSEANTELGDRQDAAMISMDVPARVLAYFAACADPFEYTGRVFFAQRELAALGLTPDD